MIEELKRVSAENKKLADMLTAVCENYTELRNQLMEHTSKTPGAPKKRKAESSINNNNTGPSESSSSDEDSSKKPREEQFKTKISHISTKTEASDTSLVSCHEYSQFLRMISGCLVLVQSIGNSALRRAITYKTIVGLFLTA